MFATKIVKYWKKNISGNIKAVFFTLRTRNVNHKRNKMTPVVLLPWQQHCCWSCLMKIKIHSFCLNQGPSTPANVMMSVKTIWAPCLFQAGTSVPLKRVANEDILFLTERDWRQDNHLGNDSMDVIWSSLWCTLLMPSLKNTASIFPEIGIIYLVFYLFSCKPYNVFTVLICIILKIWHSSISLKRFSNKQQ